MKDKGKRINVIYAKGLRAELRYRLFIDMDLGYVSKDCYKKWIVETTETSAIFSGL